MLTLSNLLSFVRFPLAFLFLQQNANLRATAILLAMLTDSIDGYLARRNRSVSKFGAILDPVMDKLFVYFVLAVYCSEHSLKLWQVFAVLSRDISLLIFAIYLTFTHGWKEVKWQAFFWGKVSTGGQFILLLVMAFKIPIPTYIYLVFILFGAFALKELFKKKG